MGEANEVTESLLGHDYSHQIAYKNSLILRLYAGHFLARWCARYMDDIESWQKSNNIYFATHCSLD